MKEIEIIKKYSDENYLSKDELFSVLDVSDKEKIWNGILIYRNFFKFETDIKDVSLTSHAVILTNTLRDKFYTLDTNMLKHSRDISLFSDEKRHEMLKYYKARLIDLLLRYYQIGSISSKIKEGMINNTVEQIPLKLEIVYSFAKAFDFTVSEEVSLKEAIYQIYKITSNDDEVTFRSDEKDDIFNISYTQTKDIENNFKQYLEFITNSSLETSLLCLISIYYFLTNQPFASQNEEIAVLVCYLIMKRRGYFLSSFILDFASISFTNSKKIYDKIALSQNSLDITYFIYFTLPYLLQDEQKVNEYLDKLKVQKNSENKKNEEEVSEMKEEEIDKKIEELLLLYPILKRKEAHFYITHSTIGYNYTINQFQTIEKTVYETARTSMDNLAKLGFYKKHHIGNKFFYAPVVLNK